MNYQNLKAIMAHVLAKVTCPHCKTIYKDSGLNIAETTQNVCVLVGICPECKNPSLIEVTILPESKPIKNTQISVKTHKQRNISENEILDMHNFLKSFNGDFKKLFTKQQ